MSDTLNRRYEAGQRAYYENHETGGQHFRAIVDAADAAVDYEAAWLVWGQMWDDSKEMVRDVVDAALGRHR